MTSTPRVQPISTPATSSLQQSPFKSSESISARKNYVDLQFLDQLRDNQSGEPMSNTEIYRNVVILFPPKKPIQLLTSFCESLLAKLFDMHVGKLIRSFSLKHMEDAHMRLHSTTQFNPSFDSQRGCVSGIRANKNIMKPGESGGRRITQSRPLGSISVRHKPRLS